jgi:hypothetical protein
MFVDLFSVFQAGAVGQAPGPNFGRTPAKNREKLKYLILPTGSHWPLLVPKRRLVGPGKARVWVRTVPEFTRDLAAPGSIGA